MRVLFETYSICYKGHSDTDLPIFEKKDIKLLEGEVIATVVMPMPNLYYSMPDHKPCFVVALDDGTFTYAPIEECTKVK